MKPCSRLTPHSASVSTSHFAAALFNLFTNKKVSVVVLQVLPWLSTRPQTVLHESAMSSSDNFLFYYDY